MWASRGQPTFDFGRLPFIAPARRGLGEAGFVVERNVAIEYRWAEGQHDVLPGFCSRAGEPSGYVIAAMGGRTAPKAAKRAMSTIPIVFSVGNAIPCRQASCSASPAQAAALPERA
jgi:hypothetical protein